MARDYTTNLVVQGKVKGFAEVSRTITQASRDVNASLAQQAKGYAEVEKRASAFSRLSGKISGTAFWSKHVASDVKAFAREMDAVKTEMSGIAREQYQVIKAMKGLDRETKHYSALKETLKDLNAEHSKLGRHLDVSRQAFTKEAEAAEKMKAAQGARKGAFTQGFAQGFVPAGFIQRGPGAFRQAAGTFAGRAARSPFDAAGAGMRAAGAAPFTGISGVAQGLAGVPVVGGVLAGQIQAAAGHVQGAMQLQRTQLGLAPQLGDVMGGGKRERLLGRKEIGRRARGARSFAEDTYVAPGFLQQDQFERTSQIEMGMRERAISSARDRIKTRQPGISHAAANVQAKRQVMDMERAIDPFRGSARQQVLGEAGMQEREQIAGGAENLSRQASARENERRTARNQQRMAAQRSLFRDFGAAGQQLMGVDKTQALQFGGAVTQAGGGTLAQMRQSGLLKTGMAAKTSYGVDESTIGSFLQAQRRGGMVGTQVGAQGAGGQALASAIADSVAAGLQGSERNEYLQIMSQGIQQWRQTGIPINPQSISELGKQASALGMDPTRGMALSKGVMGAAQSISAGGPQSGVDIAMMRAFTGYEGGGGMKELWDSMTQLEGLKGLPEDGLKQFVDIVTQGAKTPETGMAVLHAAFQKRNISVGREETELIYKKQFGGLSDEQKQRLEMLKTERETGGAIASGITEASMASGAKGAISKLGPNLGQQAGIVNRQLALGNQMADTVLTLEKVSTSTNKAFQDLVGGPLNSFSKLLDQSSQHFPAFVASAKDFGTWATGFLAAQAPDAPDTPAGGGQ